MARAQEAMRFKPVASTGTTRHTKRPLTLGGHTIPAGALLLVPFDPVHRCNFERPDDFWPVRACACSCRLGWSRLTQGKRCLSLFV